MNKKKEYKSILKYERKLYCRSTFFLFLLDKFTYKEDIVIWKFIKKLRKCEFYLSLKDTSVFYNILYQIALRKKNRMSYKIGCQIDLTAFGKGLRIYHVGNIVVNGYSKIGENCKLHGSNCIGNSRDYNDCPEIGDNVRIGVGAKIFGKIKIANNITIAAGAVVTKSFLEEGITIAGNPAQKIG